MNGPDDLASGSPPEISRGTVFRDLVIFQFKLALDSLKDVVLSPLSFIAALIVVLVGPDGRAVRLFYGLLRIGERYDLWLNLYSAASRSEVDGLFGGSEAGSSTFLGEVEQIVRGGDRPRGSDREAAGSEVRDGETE